MLCVPGASMQARAIHGLTSVSPRPLIPSSVWISTTTSSWAELAAVVSNAGCTRTWQSMPVMRKTRFLSRGEGSLSRPTGGSGASCVPPAGLASAEVKSSAGLTTSAFARTVSPIVDNVNREPKRVISR